MPFIRNPKEMDIWSNDYSYKSCVIKVNAPLPPLILEGELICSGAHCDEQGTLR